MDPTTALIAGVVAGLAIAMQVGAVSLLLIEASVVSGPRAGVAAGMGVATADFVYAAVAAAAGGVVGAALSSHESEIKIVPRSSWPRSPSTASWVHGATRRGVRSMRAGHRAPTTPASSPSPP